MSDTVAKALRLTGGEEAKETANFIEMVDKLFECVLLVKRKTAAETICATISQL